MDSQIEESLIELWTENPCLYDISSPGFSNRLEKRKALEDMGSKLNLSADAVSISLNIIPFKAVFITFSQFI